MLAAYSYPVAYLEIMVSFLSGTRARNTVLQIAVVILTAFILLTFWFTLQRNLSSQGITSGFSFLQRTTGWDITFSPIEYTTRSTYQRVLLVGFLNTLYVGLLGLVGAMLIGFVVGLMRTSSNLLMNIIGTTYVELFRNVPLILQAIVWYAVFTHLPRPKDAYTIGNTIFLSNRGLQLPSLTFSRLDAVLYAIMLISVITALGLLVRWQQKSRARLPWLFISLLSFGLLILVAFIFAFFGREAGQALMSIPEVKGFRFEGGVAIKPEFSALLLAISAFGGAYIAEIVRGGLLSVRKGYLEAARALGFKTNKVNEFVRFPLAIRAIIPPLGNRLIWLMKATTIGIAIGYPDFFMVVSTSINQSGQTMELILILMVGFLLINFTISRIMNAINRSVAIKGQGGK